VVLAHAAPTGRCCERDLQSAATTLKDLQQLDAGDRFPPDAGATFPYRGRGVRLPTLQETLREVPNLRMNLELKAPAAGLVNILPNFRAASTWGSEQEFREGDRAWPGAAILELPDLSSVHLEARLDESDRGRLKTGQDATVRIEAIPGRDFKARINNISVLAKVDFTSGWPPPKNFDLNLVLLDIDPKIRPGMTAVARIATEREPDVILVPAEAITSPPFSAISITPPRSRTSSSRTSAGVRQTRVPTSTIDWCSSGFTSPRIM
jgi:multidrug efflux pump subunit AcrA (membrane-fusion protein)